MQKNMRITVDLLIFAKSSKKTLKVKTDFFWQRQPQETLNYLVHSCSLDFHKIVLPEAISQKATPIPQQHQFLNNSSTHHCMKCIRIRSFSGPYFATFGPNTERYSVSLHIQSECGKKYGPEKVRVRAIFTQWFHAIGLFLYPLKT